jgi:hypothetical protein
MFTHSIERQPRQRHGEPMNDGSALPMLIQYGNLSRNEAVIRRRSDDGNSTNRSTESRLVENLVRRATEMFAPV